MDLGGAILATRQDAVVAFGGRVGTCVGLYGDSPCRGMPTAAMPYGKLVGGPDYCCRISVLLHPCTVRPAMHRIEH